MVDGRPRTISRTIAAGVIGLGALLAGGVATAADFRCAELKPSDTRQPPYQRVAGQLRCEGFYDRNVSQPFVELVSLTAAAPRTQDGTTLQISASRRRPTQLIVQPLRPAPFYRVDALIGPAQSVRWDAAPMLDATGLRLRDLGFLAVAPDLEGTMTVVPVGFAPSGVDAPVPLQAVLRVSVPVASLAWRSLRLDGGENGTGTWRDIPGPARFAWERVPLTLDRPTDGRSMRIEVQATDTDGKVLPLLRFNVGGSADDGS
jgi:hypothetical protein